MSRIDDVVKELCPNGVPFESLGQLLERGTSIRWTEVPGQAFQYIDLTSVDPSAHSIGDTTPITSENAPSRAQQVVREGDVLFGTTRPMLKRYCVVPPQLDGHIASTGYCVLRPKANRLLTNFLFHLMGTAAFYLFIEANERGASYPAISDGVIKEFVIPIPPLEVQHEIVRILDLFQSLEAELEKRRQQYAYYRDHLLTFPDPGVRRVAMGDVGMFFGGLTGKSKADFADGNARFVSYVNVFNHIAVDLQCDDLVRVDPGERQRRLARGDILFTGSSETPDEVGMSSVVTQEVSEPTFLNSFSIGYRTSNPDLLDPEFAKHLFRSSGMRQQIVRTASGVTRFNVSKARLAKVEFPVPSREAQVRIAAVLDTFDALVNDLTIGLPAELNARRKQYEYYRDRLLTFQELAE